SLHLRPWVADPLRPRRRADPRPPHRWSGRSAAARGGNRGGRRGRCPALPRGRPPRLDAPQQYRQPTPSTSCAFWTSAYLTPPPGWQWLLGADLVDHGIGHFAHGQPPDRKSTRLNSSHVSISYA